MMNLIINIVLGCMSPAKRRYIYIYIDDEYVWNGGIDHFAPLRSELRVVPCTTIVRLWFQVV